MHGADCAQWSEEWWSAQTELSSALGRSGKETEEVRGPKGEKEHVRFVYRSLGVLGVAHDDLIKASDPP